MTDVAATETERASIAARLNRLPITRLHKFVVVVVGLATFFDLYDLFLASTVSTVLHTDFGASSAALKPLLASAFVGAFVGAITLGRLADRLGRRNAFLFTLSVYSVFTLIGAFSTNIWMLVICRFIAGIGIGGELPLADAYLADLLPARWRGAATAWAYTVGFCGVPAAGFLARGLAEHEPVGPGRLAVAVHHRRRRRDHRVGAAVRAARVAALAGRGRPVRRGRSDRATVRGTGGRFVAGAGDQCRAGGEG